MSKQKNGFTLVELVVVVMILGILAAVAAPKLLDTSGTATDNGAKQSLSVIRDAIERYAAQNGGLLPGESDDTQATFQSDLATFLRGPFPGCPVGNQNTNVKMVTTGAPTASGTEGWAYSTDTGDFIINSTATDNAGVAYNTY